ncbi:MAG: CDP-6-deoxy-delta-3,4-glucoseen reductase [Gammaproteobacteria bacterium]|nr:CDP-6-deoxy-delta-3,4-glucoseen reductase [Gammaproteobacteria bacterium]
MSFKVVVKPSNREFTIEAGETLLDAALRNGLSFPYGCRSGVCGACKNKVLEGELDYGDNLPPAIDEQDIKAGIGLFCSAGAKSDLVVEVKEVETPGEIPIKNLPTRIASADELSDDVMRVYLKLPETERMQFLAGQYIDILMQNNKRRSFSLANAPHDDEMLELHIRHISGGRFTDKLFGHEIGEKSILRIEGPHGSFFLREDSDKPIIFMAGGTGFAPIKGIVEHAFAEGITRPMYLYWGVRSRKDIYMNDLVQKWADEHEHFHFVPVLSNALPEDNWDGRTGYVTDAIMQDFDDLSKYDIYASGAPAMVYAGRDAFVTKGMDQERYYSDAFEIAGD